MTSVSHRAPTTPEDLLARFRTTRDPDALGALFDATAPSLLRVALSIAPDAASAENALQETFLAVLEAPERWDETRPVMPWLLGILHRQVGKVRRDNARRPDPLRLPPPLSDDPSAVASSNEDQARVRAAIDELPEPYRAVAVLRWRHGLDPADIADVRGEPPGTTRSLLSRALEKLRERLGAGAFALFGWPGAKGLAGIRRALMSKATAVTATAGTTAAVVGGAIVMKKLVAACVVILLLGGGTWWTVSKIRRSTAAAKAHADVVEAAASAAERRRKHATEIESAPKSDLPPVDLDKCDRDLDLFGRVVNEDGKPVAGAKVETVRYPWRGAGWGELELYLQKEEGPATRTATDGTFAIRLDRDDKFDLSVSASGYTDVAREGCPAGERVTITLRRGASLDVTAVDDSGGPVPGVSIELMIGGAYNSGTPLVQHRDGATDASGRLSFGGLIAGSGIAYISHPTLSARYPSFERVSIPARGAVPLRVTMSAGRTVTGRVLDADTNAPIAGARISSDQRYPKPAVTDADGRYAFTGWDVGADDWRKLQVEADGYGSDQRLVPADGRVDFALHRGDRVIGRLVREDGSPVEDAYVWVYGVEVNRGMAGHSMDLKHDSVMGRTKAEGKFDLAGARRELSHTLIATAPGLARTLYDFDANSSSSTTIDLGDVEMPVGHAIAGVVVDADGKPVSDATVALAEVKRNGDRRGGFERTQRRRTDDLGRFRFPCLAEGSYAVSVEWTGAPRVTSERIDLPADADVTGVRVALPGARTISVVVVDPDGAPMSKTYVSTDVQGSDRTPVGASTDAEGRVTFRGLTATPMTIRVSRPLSGQTAASAGPVVPEGQEVRVELPRLAAIRGVAHTEDGKTFLRTSVSATRRAGGASLGSVWIEAAGAFRLEVPEGEVVDLVVSEWQTVYGDVGPPENRKTGFEGRVNGVKCPADGVDIVLRPVKAPTYDRALTVVVQDSTGVPFPGVEIGIYERNPDKSWKVKTDADGRARFEGLASHLIVLNFAEMQDLAPQHPLDIAPAHMSATPDGQEMVVKYRAGAAIRGRVVDAQGRGVAEPYIQVTTPDATYINVRGDADGRFTAYGLPGVPHQLLAQGVADGKPSGGSVEKIVPGDAEVTIPIAPPPAK